MPIEVRNKKVLLIDDRHIFHWLWTRKVKHRFTFLHAYTIQEARELFLAHSDLAAIVVDAHMDGSRRIGLRIPVKVWGFNTHTLIAELREKFQGPIIASPSQWWHFEPMKKAGCTHYCWKWDVPSFLLTLLAPPTADSPY